MAVVFGSFDEAFEFAAEQATASAKRQVVLTHPVHGRFAVQPHHKLDVWRKAGWILVDDRFFPRGGEKTVEGDCERCDGNCGGSGECRWDW